MIRFYIMAPDHDILFKCGGVLPLVLSEVQSSFGSVECINRSLPSGKGSRSGRVAQLVEHSTLNRLVVGSIPTASTISPS